MSLLDWFPETLGIGVWVRSPSTCSRSSKSLREFAEPTTSTETPPEIELVVNASMSREKSRNQTCCALTEVSNGRSWSVKAPTVAGKVLAAEPSPEASRSEEHTSELQSLRHLVCRL